MIPAKPNTWINYTAEHARGALAIGIEVVAWDNGGHPLVMTDTGLASIYPPYIKNIEVREHSQFETFTQFTPVSDLFALYKGDDGELFESRLIGWAVTAGGDIVPVSEEQGEGMIAVSRDDGYLISFREADRERAYAQHGPKTSPADVLAAYSSLTT